MKLLITTKVVDENDQLLGFSVEWFRRFAEKFDLVTILCLEKGRFSLPQNVQVISIGRYRGIFKFIELFNFYKNLWMLREQYDVVFSFMNAIWIITGTWLWRLLNKKIYLWYAHKTITWKHRLAEKWADGIFTSTPEGFRIKSKKVMVVGQGIDTTAFRPISNFQFPISNKRLLKILSVGRIALIKNYEVLFRALKILDSQNTDFSLTMIGGPVFEEDFRYEKLLKVMASESGLGNKISFLGEVSHKELPFYYQTHDLFVNLGKTGSLDKTIVEAMASGINVISSNEAASKFLPKELIVSGDNAEGLAEKIKEITGKDFGEQLRGYVLENHSLQNLIERISSQIKMKKVLAAGYPYARENYFKTFDGYKDKITFVLPEKWRSKGGKVVFSPPDGENVIKTKAFFFHSNYPIIGGSFKGFMPVFSWHLFKNRQFCDLVYSATEPILFSTLYQGLWAKFFRKKHIVFTWENIPYEKKFKGLNGVIKKMILRLNFKFCDGLVCGNRKALEIHKKFDKPAEVIPLSGVDGDKFKPMPVSKRFNGIDLSGKKVFLFAGALDFRKGVNLLLEAFEKIADGLSHVRLLIVGSGTHEKEFSELVANSRHQEKIYILPWTANEKLPELFNVSDVFVYPSISYGGWEEQFGYSMAEASLCELPVIATRTGSIDEIVIDGETGILVDENNVQELKRAMIKLAQDENLRREMGKAGRGYITNNFSYKVVADKFYSFFNKI